MWWQQAKGSLLSGMCHTGDAVKSSAPACSYDNTWQKVAVVASVSRHIASHTCLDIRMQTILPSVLMQVCLLFKWEEQDMYHVDILLSCIAARREVAPVHCRITFSAHLTLSCPALHASLQVGAGNATRWWVATQDKALQSTLGRIPGAPLIFASVNGLHLAEPLQRAKSGAASSAAAAQAVPAHELTSEALKELEELRPRDEGIKKFRRKGPKAPNPLAVKKKRTQAQQQRQQQQQQEQQHEGQKKRKRKKSKAGGAAGHGDGVAAAIGH